MGSINKDAEATLSEPTSLAEKTSSPLFIRMKEVPQISAKKINNVNARALVLVGIDMGQENN